MKGKTRERVTFTSKVSQYCNTFELLLIFSKSISFAVRCMMALHKTSKFSIKINENVIGDKFVKSKGCSTSL